MKYIGFIKEYDKISIAKDFKNYFSELKTDHTEIIKYLEKGKPFGGWMGYVSELENIEVLIDSFDYFTDGEWIWPIYYPYYLKKYPNFYVPSEFIEYIIKNKDKEISLLEEDLLGIEKIFFENYKKMEDNNYIEKEVTFESVLESNFQTDKEQPYKTYKGKNYTEEEWKIFEEKQYQEYLRKKGK